MMLESVSIFFFMNDAGKAPLDFAHLNSYSVCLVCSITTERYVLFTIPIPDMPASVICHSQIQGPTILLSPSNDVP